MCYKFKHTDGVCSYKSGFCQTQICKFLWGIKAWNTAQCLRRLFSRVIHLHMFDSWEVYKTGRPAPLLSLDAFPCLWRFCSAPHVFRPERHSWSVTTGSFRKIWNHMLQNADFSITRASEACYSGEESRGCSTFLNSSTCWGADSSNIIDGGGGLRSGDVTVTAALSKGKSLTLCTKCSHCTSCWPLGAAGGTRCCRCVWSRYLCLADYTGLFFGLIDWWDDAIALTHQIAKINQHTWCQKVCLLLLFNDIYLQFQFSVGNQAANHLSSSVFQIFVEVKSFSPWFIIDLSVLMI